jgi:hypothetical protein
MQPGTSNLSAITWLTENVSCVNSYVHCVCSTKDRLPLNSPSLREKRCAFLGSMAWQNPKKSMEGDGVEGRDHVLPFRSSTFSIANTLRFPRGLLHWIEGLNIIPSNRGLVRFNGSVPGSALIMSLFKSMSHIASCNQRQWRADAENRNVHAF